MRKPTQAEIAAAKVILAAAGVEFTQPAKPARKPRKPQPKAVAKPTKGSQTRATLSRKEWNRTLTCKAKLAGGDAYKRVLAAWDTVSEAREAGMTPDVALALVLN